MSKSGLCLGETNSEALREVSPCFIKKPITIVHLKELWRSGIMLQIILMSS